MKNESGSRKLIILTGGAGELGTEIARTLLQQGARVVLTGRNEEKLRAVSARLRDEFQWTEGPACPLDWIVMDGADANSVYQGASEIHRRHGPVDVLINNAGSAGPKQVIRDLPVLTTVSSTRTSPASSEETLEEACGSLLGSAWMTTLAFRPYLSSGASIVNVSTIFSKTPYFGRAAYVVPKAALNALSRRMSQELGSDPRRIRVNTVLPGPIESDRIRNVFAAMDRLMGAPDGSMRERVLGGMALRGAGPQGEFVHKREVAATISFLASDASSAFTGHEFEVTNGLKLTERVPQSIDVGGDSAEAARDMYFDGSGIVIIAKNETDDAYDFAVRFARRGAKVTLLLASENAVTQTKERTTSAYSMDCDQSIEILKFDPLDEKAWVPLETSLKSAPDSALAMVLIVEDRKAIDAPLFDRDAHEVEGILRDQVIHNIAIARGLDRLYFSMKGRRNDSPSVVFLSPEVGSLGEKNDLGVAAIAAVIRVWADEMATQTQSGQRDVSPRLIRAYRSHWSGGSNLEMTWARIASLCPSPRSRDNNGKVSENSIAPREDLGTHLGKVALITGGSEGIGGAVTHQLLLSGAMVVVAERNTEKLSRAWVRLTNELRRAGFLEPEKRLLLIPNSDVSLPETITNVVERTIAHFGRIDFIINNAGLVGGEKMVVDLPEATWRQTLQGNLISNYQLMNDAIDPMRRQGHGHVINMSSYFGGSRHGLVPYTNRADYAVSKAAQQALAIALAPFVGPEVQWNAIAPGPVDGARLNGVGGAPGLYLRRAKLIREGRRINQIYSAAIRAITSGMSPAYVTTMIARNEMKVLSEDANCPPQLSKLCRHLRDADQNTGGAAEWLLTRPMFDTLMRRLEFTSRFYTKKADPFTSALTFDFREPEGDFLDAGLLERDAISIRDEICSHFALKRMPSDQNLAKEVLCALAHKTVTGEVLYPTCGFRYNGFTTNGLFRYDGESVPTANTNECASGKSNRTVFVFSDSMYSQTAELAARILKSANHDNKPVRVVIISGSKMGNAELRRCLDRMGVGSNVELQTVQDREYSAVFAELSSRWGVPDAIFSFPMGNTLSDHADNGLPTTAHFSKIVDEQLTCHFLVAKWASLIPACRIVFVTPVMNEFKSGIDQALIEFIRYSVRPLTVAAGREATFLQQGTTFYQMDAGRTDENFFAQLLKVTTDAKDETKNQAAA